MARPELLAYITQQKKSKVGTEAIKTALLNQGHQDSEVEESFEQYLKAQRKRIMIIYGAILLVLIIFIMFLKAFIS